MRSGDRNGIHRVLTAAVFCLATWPAWGETRSEDVKSRLSAFAHWKTYTTQDGLPHDGIRAVRVVGDRVWVGTDGGLALLAGGKWKKWTSEDGLPARIVSAIDVDERTRDVWLGTWGDGLVRFTAGRFDRFDQLNSGLAGNLIFAVKVAGTRVWAATNGGLSSFDPLGDAWELYFAPAAHGPQTAITRLTLEGTNLYAGVRRGTTQRFDYERNEWLPVTDEREPGIIASAMTLPPAGESPWQRWPDVDVKIASTLAAGRIRCVVFADNGVWIGTARGLAHGTGVSAQKESPPAAGKQPPVGRHGEKRAVQQQAATPSTEHVSRIAVLGPHNRTISRPGNGPGEARRKRQSDLLAVRLAIEHANSQGGYRGRTPFELAVHYPGYLNYGWGTPEDEFPQFASDENVVGLIGFLGPDDSITEAVAAFTEIPVVNVAAAPEDEGGTVAGSPWVFRCWGDLPRQHRLLLDHVFDRLGKTRLAAIFTPGETARRHLAWWRSHARSRGHPFVGEVHYDPACRRLDPVLEKLRRLEPDVVLTWCDADTSGAILQRMRRRGMNQLFIGGPQILGDDFLARVGSDAGPVIALYPTDRPESTRMPAAQAAKYLERNLIGTTHRPPGPGACRSFDATLHLLEAIGPGGASRDDVQDRLQAMRYGAAGERHYERLHRDAQTTIARLEAGAWVLQTLRPGK